MKQNDDKIKRLENLLKASYCAQSSAEPSPQWRENLLRTIRTSAPDGLSSEILERIIWRFATTGAAAAFAIVLMGIRIGDGASSGFAAFDPIGGIELSDDVEDDNDDIDLWDVQS